MLALFARLRSKALQILSRLLVRVAPRSDLVRLGSGYGGWTIPASSLSATSVCLCAGAGEDITFDLALVQRYGCRVFAIDPTPRARAHFETAARGVDRLTLLPFGLWNKDETARFYAPKDPTHVSHSIQNLQGTSEYFEASCKRLSTVLAELGHASIDLLKLDIEGSEYAVLDDMLDGPLRPGVVLVEFDQPVPFTRTLAMIRRLEREGYELVRVERWNYSFARRVS